MDSSLIKFVLCGVLLCNVLGCSAINRSATIPRNEQTVVEQDIAEDVRGDRPDRSYHDPSIGDRPPAPAVEEPWQGVSPGERPPRRYNWSDRKGWSPGDPDKAGARP
ncbi:MAG: hypothetical protein RDU20_17235 [Desulfomonilaceae bacterium]|nr:hypothetical protein [Desulfomonilaceae bacterium]